MDFNKLKLLFNTLKYLKFKQVYFRIFYFFRNRFFKRNYAKIINFDIKPIFWENFILNNNSYQNNKFTFLNLSKEFRNQIHWNYKEFGVLWTFNINYFDFLNQKEINVTNGLALINDYIKQDESLEYGKESYPISLRNINWVKFLSKNRIEDKKINQYLYNYYQILVNNLEYHLLGNHLLENGFSLLFGAYYFNDDKLYSTAKKILKEELKEQILNDGGHYELSPMYHQIILFRVLDCINLIKCNHFKNDELFGFLKEKSIKMLSWLQTVTYQNGNIPLVNDSANGIAPTSLELFKYAIFLEITWSASKLGKTGYRKINKKNYELFLDVGNIQPSYQPAHTHSDTFSYELYFDKIPFIVDRGVSTYNKNNLRNEERSTSSHNTIQIGDFEQTQVWGGFRVGKRAKVFNLLEEENKIMASHNGYKKYGLIHQREFNFDQKEIKIKDVIIGKTKENQKSALHFHPNITNLSILDNKIICKQLNKSIVVSGDILKIEKESYNYSFGFNKVEKAIKINILFNNKVEYKIISE